MCVRAEGCAHFEKHMTQAEAPAGEYEYWLAELHGGRRLSDAGKVLLTRAFEKGMIEVMKTFTTVAFSGGEEWPARLRLKAWLAQDGAEVTQGEALIELEGD